MKNKTQKMVGVALLTAIIAVLQIAFSGAVRFGTFSVSLVLVPIVIGAALYGYKAGAWLGLVFSVCVLISGDASLFLAINVPGTIITVILKGTIAGLLAGIIYSLLEKVNKYFSVIAAAVICPLVNTGLFLLGCRVFFFEAIGNMALANGMESAAKFMIVGLVGLNFFFELGVNVVLGPVIVRLVNIGKKEIAKS